MHDIHFFKHYCKYMLSTNGRPRRTFRTVRSHKSANVSSLTRPAASSICPSSSTNSLAHVARRSVARRADLVDVVALHPQAHRLHHVGPEFLLVADV